VFLVMPFTTSFMKLTPERYVHELLVENLHVVEVVVVRTSLSARRPPVPSTRCAVRRAVGVCGRSDSLVSEHHDTETVTFSSTYIRSCVDAGDVVAAAEALGRHTGWKAWWCAATDGGPRWVSHRQRGPPMYSAIPADGVYAACSPSWATDR